MNKKSFIECLKTMSKDDLDKFIKEKGKPRKLINPIIHIMDDEEPKHVKSEVNTKVLA